MTTPKLAPVQSVPIVEADVLDRMNETQELIAKRAFEIYQSRGRADGHDLDDWLTAEKELIPQIDVEYKVGDQAVQLTAQVPGFQANDLEVAVGHKRAVICGTHPTPGTGDQHKIVIQVIELPYDVDSFSATATLEGSTLYITLPRA